MSRWPSSTSSATSSPAHRPEREQARVEALLAARGRPAPAERSARRRPRAERPCPRRREVEDLERAARQAAAARRSVGAARGARPPTAAAIGRGDQRVHRSRSKASPRLADRHPILLFPLRLETRFKSSADRDSPSCGSASTPTTASSTRSRRRSPSRRSQNGRRRSGPAIWRAGGDEALERAAWRELVAAHGSGRAGWIVAPLPAAQPGGQADAEAGAGRLILVVAATGTLAGRGRDLLGGGVARRRQPALHAQAAVRRARRRARCRRRRSESSTTTGRSTSTTPRPAGTRPGRRGHRCAVLQVSRAERSRRARRRGRAPPGLERPARPVRAARVRRPGSGRHGSSSAARPGPLVGRPRSQRAAGEQLEAGRRRRPRTADPRRRCAWMFDFERALAVGMAFRFDLTAEQAARRLRAARRARRPADRHAPTPGRDRLARLLEHHLHSRSRPRAAAARGRPRTTPRAGGSGYALRDDPDATLRPLLQAAAAVLARRRSRYAPRRPAARRRASGCPTTLVHADPARRRSPTSAEARAMQIALWPATLGYMMDTLLDAGVQRRRRSPRPGSSSPDTSAGAGPLPALRIGRQPYGIVPPSRSTGSTGSTSRSTRRAFLGTRATLILRRSRPRTGRRCSPREPDRRGRRGPAPGAARRARPAPDVGGVLPARRRQRRAQVLRARLPRLRARRSSCSALFPAQEPHDAAAQASATAATRCPICSTKIYRARQTPLDGPLVDDVPLSETRPDPRATRAGATTSSGWSTPPGPASPPSRRSRASTAASRRRRCSTCCSATPSSSASATTAIGLARRRPGSCRTSAMLRREPAFVHVATSPPASESRYDAPVRGRSSEVTGERRTSRLGDYIARHDRVARAGAAARAPRPRSTGSPTLPTARLERLFAEHIDTASYRLDAWKTGSCTSSCEPALRQRGAATRRAQERRRRGEGAGGSTSARSAGSRPAPGPQGPDPVELPAGPRRRASTRTATAPLMRDPTNVGLVHAPSINHAATAAVLRNGYVAHERRDSPSTSRRAASGSRSAILEGMRNGQSLGALLGYQFERHVHDNGPLTVRDLVYPSAPRVPAGRRPDRHDRDDETGTRRSRSPP